jgi:hypothetical protein
MEVHIIMENVKHVTTKNVIKETMGIVLKMS